MKVRVSGEAAEVATAEAQAVLAMVQNEERRGRLADVIAAIADGEVSGDDADALAELLELGLQTGRIRAYYGPGGEQAALATLRKLPKGRGRTESAREVSTALQALNGAQIDAVKIAAIAPGAFTLTIEAGGVEAAVRLDNNGARVTSLAT